MKFLQRFQQVGAGAQAGLRWTAAGLWLIAATRPWAISLDSTDLGRGLAVAVSLGILGAARHYNPWKPLRIHRAVRIGLLVALPWVGGLAASLGGMGGSLSAPLAAVCALGAAAALAPLLSTGSARRPGRHDNLASVGVALAVLVADVWPGPLLPLTALGMVAALAVAALEGSSEPGRSPGIPPLDRPAALRAAALGAALGAAGWALHRPWVAFLTPTRASEAEWLAGFLVAAALGAATLRRAPTGALTAASALGAAAAAWFAADLPLTLGLWGLMDQESWAALQGARLLLAAGLAAPVALPLGGAAARGPGGPLLLGAGLGVGAALGLLPILGAHGILLGAAGLAAAIGLMGSGQRRWIAAAVATAAIAGAALFTSWSPQLMSGAVYPQMLRREGVRRSLADARARLPRLVAEDRHGAVAVFEGKPAPSLVIGGAPVGTGPGQIEDERFAGHLGALLHLHPEAAAVLGPGTGVAIAALIDHDVDVTAVSASPARMAALRHLGDVNAGAVPGPGVLQVVEATRRHLASHPGTYDLILQPPWPQWTAETSLAWTRERFSLMQGALRGEGLAVVTVPLDSLGPRDLAAILAAFASAFPRTSAWLPPSGSHDLVLVGHRGGAPISYLGLVKSFAHPRAREALTAMGLAEPADLLGRLLTGPQGVAAVTAEATPTRDSRPILDASLPDAAFRPPAAHPLTLFTGHLDDALPLMDDVDKGPTTDALRLNLQRAQESHRALLDLLASLGEGSYDEAVTAVLRMGPRSDREIQGLISPYLERARRDMNLGLLDQADAQLGFATVLAPRQAMPWLLKARIHLRREDPARAQEAYRQALERDPDSLEALMGLADLATTDGRHAEAIGYLERARKLDPSRGVIAHNLGELYRTTGDLERAARSFAEALLLDSSLAAAHAGLADIRLRQGQLGQALSEAQTAVRLDDAPLHLEILGQALLALSDYNRARSAFVQCLLKDPDSVGCLGGLGIVYAEDGQTDKARATWQRLLDVAPGHPAALENLRRLDELSAQRAGSGGIKIQEMAIPEQ